MSTVFKIYPYKQGSKSAKALADALGGKVLKREGSSWVPNPRHNNVVINWGSSRIPAFDNAVVLNADNTEIVSNKLTFFRSFLNDAQTVPLYWTDADDIPDEAFPIVCRTILNGHSGAGIVIANSRDDLVDAPLYVKYIKKQDEYRVHLGLKPDGEDFEAICIQKKMLRNGHENPNWKIRNHSNGFIYGREGFEPPACVLEAAISAMNCFALDFGAVDIIYNSHYDRAYVLEINTAPGLEGQTIQDYANYFNFYFGDNNNG
jgi:hypothetical protein